MAGASPAALRRSPPRVEPMEPRDREAWDAFVEGCGEATFCHLSGWWAVMERTLGHQVVPLVARGPEGALEGVLPVVSMRSLPFGRSLVSMPFLNYGGAIGSAPARAALTASAVALADREGYRRLVLRERVEAGEGTPSARSKVTVLLELPADPAQLWDGFRPKVRSQVRRPLKEGMETRFGAGELDGFYDVFRRNMRDLGTPVLPRRFFEALPGAFPGRVLVGTVRHRGRVVAAGCGFLFGGEFEMTWASSLREANPMAPNMLLYWRFMERAIEEGAQAFNFGRCTPGGGTHRFKRQWGGRDVPLPWRAWPTRGGAEVPSRDGGAYGLASALWRRLPLPVANVLGPALARRLPTF